MRLQEPVTQFPVGGQELETAGIVGRVRQAFATRRTLVEVTTATGLPYNTLKRLQDGQEPKLMQAIRIANGLGVRLEWLATGRGPMREGEAPPESGSGLRYLDFENLAAGLDVAEQLSPEAPPEARISAALRVAERLRQGQGRDGMPNLDASRLATCLGMIETVFGRRTPVIPRLRLAANAFELLPQHLPEDGAANPPAAPAGATDKDPKPA